MTDQVIKNYLGKINTLFISGNATEHSYRGDLQNLVGEIIDDDTILITNEPSRIRDVGAPDYSITKTKDKFALGYIEAKDIADPDLEGKKAHKEQFNRYKNALPNLIITDYLRFHFYQQGELKSKITLATIENKHIKENEQAFELFINSIKSFIAYVAQTITSPSLLAKLMAGKARLLENIIEKSILSDEESILSDEENAANDSLKNQLEVFQKYLIHDLTAQSFADIYAQTIAYGLFTARLHDENLQTFSREEAQNLIPKTNPFLRGLFSYIGGVDCDDRIVWIIDSLAEIYLHTDVESILKKFDNKKEMNDPIIHFYETFLSEYNPALRKSRGVWYTPQPVVNFIVRAVNEVLKTEFKLDDGLLDESKINISVDALQTRLTKSGTQKQKEVSTHRVQILDPATGTGTFLAETIKIMKKEYFGTSWSNYVEQSLIPRMHGFELLMASYAMAHLKLDLLLMETGYKPTKNTHQRFKIFLTNSLEEYHPDTGTLFVQSLANESRQANKVKKETPVMVVMGNPPYSGESANKGDWIMRLMEDYKQEPGGEIKLQERNPKWINDDYVKFIRLGQHSIEKNGEGLLAFINPHGFLDNPTFRGMRWHLLKTFDKIYTIDLHGNAKKKETAPDGSIDENVFDIQQGVSINIFIKTGKKQPNQLGQVYHFDLFGKREEKYDFLYKHSLKNIPFTKILNKAPMYFMVQKDFELETQYQKGFSLTGLFPVNGTGIVSKRDKIAFHHSKQEVEKIIKHLILLSPDEMRSKYPQGNWDSRDGKAEFVKICLNELGFQKELIAKCSYRPFDNRYTYYNKKSKGFIGWPVYEVMQHFLKGENVGLVLCKQFKSGNTYQHSFITSNIIESSYISNRTSEINSAFLLYLYPDEDSVETARIPNLNLGIVKEIEKKLELSFIADHENLKKVQHDKHFSPLDIVDYIYAVLHSPTYRETYNEFLKIDFPRVPYPDKKTFWQLVKLGGKLRTIHLLEDTTLDKRTIAVKGEGDDVITNRLTKNDFIMSKNKVALKINEQITLTNIPLVAWEFYIGGYQPAQKWLKDRIGRSLSMHDLKHYNRIINALVKTDKLMQQIEKIKII